MTANAVVIVVLPDGTAGAFPLPAVAEARRLAAKLGFGPSPADRSVPAPPDVAGHTADSVPWITVERLAASSGLKPAHIRASARAGLLPSRLVGRRVLLPANALAAAGATALPAVSD